MHRDADGKTRPGGRWLSLSGRLQHFCSPPALWGSLLTGLCCVIGLSLLLLACQTRAPGTEEAVLDPDEHLLALKAGLDEALLMWQGAQPAQAREILEQTYTAHFEPFEPSLKAQGVEILQIEYDFGRLGHRMRRAPSSRKSDAEEVSAQLTELTADVEAAFDALPATSGLQPPR